MPGVHKAFAAERKKPRPLKRTLCFRTMVSRKRKLRRTDESKLRRAKALSGINTCDPDIKPPSDAILADHTQLQHNNTYDPLPLFYVDKVLCCRSCGKEEVWSAQQQKWWYEIAKGNINSKAIHCRACRDIEKKRKDAARRTHLAGLKRKQSSQNKT